MPKLSKHSAAVPSSSKQCTKILLLDAQLDALSSYMEHMSNLMNWRTRVQEVKNNDLIWLRICSYILMELMEQLGDTDMKRDVIPEPTLPDARYLFASFNDQNIWNSGKMACSENGAHAEKDDWSGLLQLAHHALHYKKKQAWTKTIICRNLVIQEPLQLECWEGRRPGQ